ncbi:MAG TPA: Fe-S protein assembly co-chaperone HscB, partial [Burkholderiales bacterium]|nr:Fe-S protein assembly co-chaperone HscB [Burkholderiales bacterium]
FDLFGLAPAYALESEALERSYREIQSRVHPDRFAHAGDAERRASLQWTTRVNEAYRTLKDPVQRAKHLLELHGVDVAFETNTAMPGDFLAQQMELRESLEEAKNVAALDELRKNLRAESRSLEKAITEAIDAKKDYAGAAGLVRKLQFLDKLDAEIDAAYETIE